MSSISNPLLISRKRVLPDVNGAHKGDKKPFFPNNKQGKSRKDNLLNLQNLAKTIDRNEIHCKKRKVSTSLKLAERDATTPAIAHGTLPILIKSSRSSGDNSSSTASTIPVNNDRVFLTKRIYRHSILYSVARIPKRVLPNRHILNQV